MAARLAMLLCAVLAASALPSRAARLRHGLRRGSVRQLVKPPVCACGNLPKTGACNDACGAPSADKETECKRMGFASCADYCLKGDMGGKCTTAGQANRTLGSFGPPCDTGGIGLTCAPACASFGAACESCLVSQFGLAGQTCWQLVDWKANGRGCKSKYVHRVCV